MTHTVSRPKPQVAVIVVNWNSWRLSLRCLESLRAGAGATWHLFLVDNASSDDSRHRLRDLGDDVTLLLSETNGGWTGGNNLGVRAAMDAGFERFFILNSDAEVKEDTLAKLQVLSERQSPPPILGPLHRTEDGAFDFIGSVTNPSDGMPQLMKAHEIDVAGLEPLYPTAYIRGAGLFVAREHFEIVGLFDDEYYLNFDETDWCYRARAAGFDILMARDVEIIHIGSASIGGALSPLNIYFIVRNGLLFAERHCSKRQRLNHAASLARWLTTLSDRRSRVRRVLGLGLGRGKQAVAARRGARDYLLRRFGDCPPFIRKLSRSR